MKSRYVLSHHKQKELQVMTFNTLYYFFSGYVFVNTRRGKLRALWLLPGFLLYLCRSQHSTWVAGAEGLIRTELDDLPHKADPSRATIMRNNNTKVLGEGKVPRLGLSIFVFIASQPVSLQPALLICKEAAFS